MHYLSVRPFGRAYTRSLLLLCTSIAVAGCERSNTSPLAPPPTSALPNIANLVVGPAAMALRPDGQLELKAPTHLSPSRREISELRARELAQAFVVTHARGFRPILERDHGGPIDVDALHLCGRGWYANAPFEPLPTAVPAVWHRVYGPWWLLTLCSSDERPQVSLAVSAYATELAIRDGRLVYPKIFGQEMEVLGIPSKLVSGLPASPERAVELAAKLTGVRVAGVPELISAPGQFPQSARWRLRLEKPVDIAARDTDLTVRRIAGVKEVFVSTTYWANPDEVSIADPHQPATRELSFRVDPVLGSTRAQVEARPVGSATLVRRIDFPVRYLKTEGSR